MDDERAAAGFKVGDSERRGPSLSHDTFPTGDRMAELC